MAKNTVPVNFKDDIMNSSMGGKRRYKIINNSDGTISLEDATTYDQVGSNFGAAQLNATNQAVNAAADAGKIIDDIDAIRNVTKEGYMAGALALKQVDNSLTNENSETFNFGVKDGVRGFYTNPSRADDSFIPFSAKTPYIDVRGLTSNTSNEYFDFSVSASRYNTSPDVFYKAVNGDGKSSNSEYGWYATSPLTITVKLKKHVPTAFLLNVTGITNAPLAIGVANLASYTNIEMDVNNGSARRYLFRPTCGIGESFSLKFNSGYEWSSFTDFHLIAY